jgi:hypothetical protein
MGIEGFGIGSCLQINGGWVDRRVEIVYHVYAYS